MYHNTIQMQILADVLNCATTMIAQFIRRRSGPSQPCGALLRNGQARARVDFVLGGHQPYDVPGCRAVEPRQVLPALGGARRCRKGECGRLSAW
jgi:hypothetical protein